jgi:predicted protein tyrosine phosphatase
VDDALVIHVCSREEAGAILSSPRDRADVAFLISIGEVHDTPPAGYRYIRDRLRLLFADATDESGPTEDDVRRIIDVARLVGKRTGRVVIHCQAGISRSTAAAIIVQATILGSGAEDDAVARVFEQRPIARPNRRMIAIADSLLEREGRLIAAVDARMR